MVGQVQRAASNANGQASQRDHRRPGAISATLLATHLLACVLWLNVRPAMAEIVWNGDFSAGNFSQYHRVGRPGEVNFPSVPPYGRPIQYGSQSHTGNGDLLSLVSVDGRTVNGIKFPQGPTRGKSPYAAKFVVKNSQNGIEPQDCDPTPADTCTRRRAQLKMQATHPDDYNALPHMGEQWVAASFFVPNDWPASASGWGPLLFGIKQREDSYAGSGYFAISLANNAWRITHRWNDALNARDTGEPWQYEMFYAGNEGGKPYPRTDSWPDGMVDFPNASESYAALQSLRKNEWTDWVLHYKQDHRGAGSGGTGFLKLWKREGAGQWVQVLHIKPKRTTRGGMTFDHGIGYNIPGSGAGSIVGLYMDKGQVWTSPANRVMYVANHKIGNSRSTFRDMSPDGSSPDGDAKPASPTIMSVQ